MAFIHYDEKTVTDWKQGEWRFIEYLNGQLVRQYDAIIRNNENMIEWRKEQPAISTDCEDLVVNKAAIVSDEASHNDFWRGCRISVWWGALGWRRDCCPAVQMPLTLTGAAQLQTPACASYKLWQQGRAVKFRLKALLSGLDCNGFWTALSQWMEGGITREVESYKGPRFWGT